jgi:hypothetical protein
MLNNGTALAARPFDLELARGLDKLVHSIRYWEFGFLAGAT